jgi:hypothetical protein
MVPKRTRKTSILTRANGGIYGFALDSVEVDSEWEFFCECGRGDCHEVVMLSMDAYTAIRDTRNAVLARGHHLSQVERARRLIEESRAPRAQAERQTDRARKNLGQDS